jgi:hypothetical protein
MHLARAGGQAGGFDAPAFGGGGRNHRPRAAPACRIGSQFTGVAVDPPATCGP